MLLLSAGSGASAKGLSATLEELLKTHQQVLAADADLAAAKERAEAAWSAWYPTLDVTASYGQEVQKKGAGVADTNMPPREMDVSVSQQLWDFGATNAAIRRARLELDQAQANLRAARQSVTLAGLRTHLDILRNTKILDFAQGSIANIKRQAELEDSRVQRGSGLATDVLQAKTQLAGAEATRIQALGALKRARNRYKNVYDHFPEKPRKMRQPPLPLDLLTENVDQAIEIAFKENPRLTAARTAAAIAREDITRTRADEFLPTLDATASRTWQEDFAGTIGGKVETLFKVEMNYSLNLGLTGVNTLKAAKHTQSAAEQRYINTRDQVEEQVRSGWDDLETARDSAQQLHNQANIAAEFLELARRERQLGNRSLIDVLAGETSLINSSSQAASADIDVAVAVFSLLNAMGRLTPQVIK